MFSVILASLNRDSGFTFEENRMVLRLPNYDPDFDDGTYTISVTQMQSADFQEQEITVAGHGR